MLSTARAILGRPTVLLLDEPLEGLAPVICEELMAAFTRLASSGDMTILLVEQRLESGARFRRQGADPGARACRLDGHERGQLRADDSLIEHYIGVGTLH